MGGGAYPIMTAVRVGDLKKFSAVVEQFADGFRKDKIYTLILRYILNSE